MLQPPHQTFHDGLFLPKELAYQLVGPRHNSPDLRINFLRCLLTVHLRRCGRNAGQERRGRLKVRIKIAIKPRFFLGRQNQLEKVCLQFREIGSRITAKVPTLRALLAAGFKVVS